MTKTILIMPDSCEVRTVKELADWLNTNDPDVNHELVYDIKARTNRPVTFKMADRLFVTYGADYKYKATASFPETGRQIIVQFRKGLPTYHVSLRNAQ